MATNKHFVIEVKPTITASKQASMADGDVLFDWTALTIPRGSAKLTNLTVMLRGNDGSPQTARDINFYFAKSIDGVAPGSLGTLSATANGIGYYNHLIAKVHLEASGDTGKLKKYLESKPRSELKRLTQKYFPKMAGSPLKGTPKKGKSISSGDYLKSRMY